MESSALTEHMRQLATAPVCSGRWWPVSKKNFQKSNLTNKKKKFMSKKQFQLTLIVKNILMSI